MKTEKWIQKIKELQLLYSVTKICFNLAFSFIFYVKWPVQFSRSVVSDSLQPHGLYVTRQASLSITNSQSLLELMSIMLVMPSNHLILCCPLLFPPSICLSIWVFSNESTLRMRWPKYWSYSFSFSPVRLCATP